MQFSMLSLFVILSVSSLCAGSIGLMKFDAGDQAGAAGAGFAFLCFVYSAAVICRRMAQGGDL